MTPDPTSKLLFGIAVGLLSASAFGLFRDWSPSTAALTAIALLLIVLLDHTAYILAELRKVPRQEGRP